MIFDNRLLIWLIYAFFTILVLAILFLFLAVIHIPSYAWGGSLPGGGVWDAWGVRVYPAFYLYYPLALLFIVIAMIFYPFLLNAVVRSKVSIPSTRINFVIVLGLLVPTEFIFGNPPVLTYGVDELGLLFYHIIAPLYRFTIEWMVGIHPTVAPIGILYIGIACCLFLYESGEIDYRMFLVPIILVSMFSLGVSVSLIVSLITTPLDLPTLQVIVPSFPLGILILGQQIRKERSEKAIQNDR